MRLLFLASVLTLAATATIASVDARADQDTLAKIVGVWKERENRTKQLLFTWTESVTQPRPSVLDQSIRTTPEERQTPSQQHQETANTPAAVLDAWQRRQKKIRTATFTWTQRHTQGAHSLVQFREENGQRRIIPYPAITTTNDISKTLSIDGLKMSYTKVSKVLLEGQEDPVAHTYMSMWDGNTSQVLTPPGIKSYPILQLRRENTHLDARNIYLQPILMWMRPLAEEYSLYTKGPLHVTDAKAVLNNEPCIVLEAKEKDSVRRILWVDHLRGFVVRRLSIMRGDTATLTIAMEYTNQGDHEWVPAQWHVAWHAQTGALLESCLSSVEKAELNTVIATDVFSPKTLPGTLVVDSRTEPEKRFIHQADGTMRAILPHEVGLSYEQLMKGTGGNGRVAWMVLLLLGGVVSLWVLWVRWLQWRRS